MITDLSHISIIVKDVDASRRFYIDALGMQEVPRPKSFNFDGAWFRSGSAEIHLIWVDDAAQQPGDSECNVTPERDAARARHFAFAVDDLEAMRSRLQEHGVAVVLGPRPRGDGTIQMYCFDPDGHLVELHS